MEDKCEHKWEKQRCRCLSCPTYCCSECGVESNCGSEPHNYWISKSGVTTGELECLHCCHIPVEQDYKKIIEEVYLKCDSEERTELLALAKKYWYTFDDHDFRYEAYKHLLTLENG